MPVFSANSFRLFFQILAHYAPATLTKSGGWWGRVYVGLLQEFPKRIFSILTAVAAAESVEVIMMDRPFPDRQYVAMILDLSLAISY